MVNKGIIFEGVPVLGLIQLSLSPDCGKEAREKGMELLEEILSALIDDLKRE